MINKLRLSSCPFAGHTVFSWSLTAPGWALHQCGSHRRRAVWQCWGAESAAGCPPLALFPPAALLESWPYSAAFWWTWQRIPDLCFSLCTALRWQTVHWNKEAESQGCKENSFDLKLNIMARLKYFFKPIASKNNHYNLWDRPIHRLLLACCRSQTISHTKSMTQQRVFKSQSSCEQRGEIELRFFLNQTLCYIQMLWLWKCEWQEVVLSTQIFLRGAVLRSIFYLWKAAVTLVCLHGNMKLCLFCAWDDAIIIPIPYFLYYLFISTAFLIAWTPQHSYSTVEALWLKFPPLLPIYNCFTNTLIIAPTQYKQTSCK